MLSFAPILLEERYLSITRLSQLAVLTRNERQILDEVIRAEFIDLELLKILNQLLRCLPDHLQLFFIFGDLRILPGQSFF